MVRIFDNSSKFISAAAFALGLLVSLDGAQAKSNFELLYAFCIQSNCTDGSSPVAGLIEDKGYNLYGTTLGGGWKDEGTVFRIAPDGSETVLYAFTGGSDGGGPFGSLIEDESGNLYGTTDAGGNTACQAGCGAVFRLAPNGVQTVLYAFAGGTDGGGPQAGLIKDNSGNFYGTTGGGGTHNDGTVFKLAADGTETVLHSFANSDGAYPLAPLIRDRKGNLYGTASLGGAHNEGVAFKLAPSGVLTVIHAFAGGSDGGYPLGGLIEGKQGNLYGTTAFGCGGCLGTVFELARDGTETVLHSFTGGSDGSSPFAGVIKDAEGNLYGTTIYGGFYGHGIVFKLAPDGTFTTLYPFEGQPDGCSSRAGLIDDKRGNLYRTTSLCGKVNAGTVFKLKQ